MKYAFFPGCVSRGGCPELYPAAVMVAEKMGLELIELKDVGCTGAGVLSRDVSDPINARTLAKAEALGIPLMTICSTCQGVLTQANYRFQHDPAYLKEINERFLKEEGLEYKGTTVIKHMLWVIMEDFGTEKLEKLVTRQLTGLKVATFYGCYLRRPSEMMVPEGFSSRNMYLQNMAALFGAEVVDTSGKSKCCGFPLLTTNYENSLEMTGDHTLEARQKGANVMVTPCPLCHLSLDGKQPDAESQKNEEIDLPILHLPQLVGLAMGFSPKQMGLDHHIVDTKSLEEVLIKP